MQYGISELQETLILMMLKLFFRIRPYCYVAGNMWFQQLNIKEYSYVQPLSFAQCSLSGIY